MAFKLILCFILLIPFQAWPQMPGIDLKYSDNKWYYAIDGSPHALTIPLSPPQGHGVKYGIQSGSNLMIYMLDSVVGRLIDAISGTTTPFSKQEMVYNYQQKNTTVLWSAWDVTHNQWIPGNRYDVTWDQTHTESLSSMKHSVWNDLTNQWMADFEYEYHYDHLGLVEEMYQFSWDQMTGQRIPVARSDHFWTHAPDLLTEVLTYLWDESANTWKVVFHMELHYDPYSGNLLNRYGSVWVDSLSGWAPNYKHIYTYYPDHSLWSRLIRLYQPALQTYQDEQKSTYTYDALGRQESFEFERLNPQSNQMIKEIRSEYFYDAEGFHVKTSNFGWDEWAQLWDPLDSTYTTWSTPGHISNVALPFLYDVGAADWTGPSGLRVPLIKNIYAYNPVQSSYSLDAHYEYYYSTQPLGTEPVEQIDISVFPNPASDMLRVETLEGNQLHLTISDMQGRMVLSEQINGSVTVRIGHLAPGLYLCHILDDSGRVILRRKQVVK